MFSTGSFAYVFAYVELLSVQEYIVKAAFLYNFAKFVEWPAKTFTEEEAIMYLCILGKDPFGVAIESIEGKSVRGRQLVIRRLAKIEDLEECPCHILFISSSEEKRLAQIFLKLEDRNVLTVGDMKGFAQRGGIINFIMVENRIRFEINVKEAERTGLEISSKLLNLAKIVRAIQRGEKNNETLPR